MTARNILAAVVTGAAFGLVVHLLTKPKGSVAEFGPVGGTGSSDVELGAPKIGSTTGYNNK